jgi:D-alanyl-D-alanine carboxypeptidase
MMNDEAAQLGMQDSHFTNPHGLDSPELYSSALDMARAGRAYLNVPFLADVGTTGSYRAGGPNGILLKNGNRLLTSYPGITGVKIGYTTKAQQTIVASAHRGVREIVLAVMGSPDRYAAAASLFDWAFDSLPDTGCINR